MMKSSLSRLLPVSAGAAFILGTFASIASAADLPTEIQEPDLQPLPVQAYDWSGFYAGGNIGFGFAGEFENDAALDLDGASGLLVGGVVGFNHQIEQFVIGVEGDINYSTAIAEVGVVDAELEYLGTITARAGYTPIDRFLTYLEGGYAFGGAEVSVPGASDSNFHSGWVVGAGAEYAVTDNILTGIEYNYVDLQDQTFNVPGPVESDFSGHNVKFNLKYKF